MFKYDDESMVRRLDVHIRLTEEEHQLLKQYGVQIRAPNLTKAARKAMLFGIKMWSKCGQNVVTFEETNNERKESNKEKEETKKVVVYGIRWNCNAYECARRVRT